MCSKGNVTFSLVISYLVSNFSYASHASAPSSASTAGGSAIFAAIIDTEASLVKACSAPYSGDSGTRLSSPPGPNSIAQGFDSWTKSAMYFLTDKDGNSDPRVLSASSTFFCKRVGGPDGKLCTFNRSKDKDGKPTGKVDPNKPFIELSAEDARNRQGENIIQMVPVYTGKGFEWRSMNSGGLQPPGMLGTPGPGGAAPYHLGGNSRMSPIAVPQITYTPSPQMAQIPPSPQAQPQQTQPQTQPQRSSPKRRKARPRRPNSDDDQSFRPRGRGRGRCSPGGG